MNAPLPFSPRAPRGHVPRTQRGGVGRDFGRVVHPTRILEITRGRSGAEVMTPITWDAIRYGEPIEDWIFEEDMPKKSGTL